MLRPLNEIRQLWKEVNINKQPHPIVKCVDCGQYIVHNLNLIQRHYLEVHHVDDHRELMERGFKFNPTTLR